MPSGVRRRRRPHASRAARREAPQRRSLHGPSREVDQEIESEIERYDDRRGDARQRKGTGRAAADDFFDLGVAAGVIAWWCHGPLLIPAAACAARSPALA